MGDVMRNWWQAVVAWVVSPAVSWVDLMFSGIILAAVVIAVLFSIALFPRLLRLSIMSGANFDVKTVASGSLATATSTSFRWCGRRTASPVSPSATS